MVGSGVVDDRRDACLPGAVRAAVEGAVRFDAVADDLAAAVLADWREAMNGTFEAVEGVGPARGDDLEGEVVVVPSDFTHGHGGLLERGDGFASSSPGAGTPHQPRKYRFGRGAKGGTGNTRTWTP